MEGIEEQVMAAAPASRKRLEELFLAHSHDAVRLATVLTGDPEAASDIVQDAFVRLFGRFRDLREPEAFHMYLRRVIVNLARDRFRRLKSERTKTERASRLRGRDSSTLPDIESREALRAALLTLPYRQRAALVLRYYEDLSEREIADLLQCSVPAVKSLLTRALASTRDNVRGEVWT